MSFFSTLLLKNNLPKHDGRPLWKYMLSNNDYEKLVIELRTARPSRIDPRDVTLYYAQWWKNNYNGGKLSKQEVLNSIAINTSFDLTSEQYYKLGIKGAQMLGIKWITKQNTLFFRTLLLQGGLPLAHIVENQGNYQNFLLAVLEEQPEIMEDFMFKPQITNLLPKLGQNDIIYENCFEIVKSILNDENIYDDLLNSDEVLTNITSKLKLRKSTLNQKERLSKPKNYWILSFKNDTISIHLRLGFADKYTSESLSNILGFDATEKEYQFYLNDELICKFRKMTNGIYKTDRYQLQNQEWDGENAFPYVYVIRDGEKAEVLDFIQTLPNLYEPTLWSKHSDNEWRLIKGNSASNKEASILFPEYWNSNLPSLKISLHNIILSWLEFEGEVEINNEEKKLKYLSDVNSFDWTIVSQKPKWIIKGSMVIVQRKPIIIIYDENNHRLPENKFKIWIKKHNSNTIWEELLNLKYIPLGCIDIKIEKDNLVAYDMFFNIGDFQIKYITKSIEFSKLEVKNIDSLIFTLYQSTIFDLEKKNNNYFLKINNHSLKIPTGLKGNIGEVNQKKLYFELESPFQGMTIIDRNGNIVPEGQKLSISNLYGLRILSSQNSGTVISIKNRLKSDVKITKEIKEVSYPIIDLKNEIVRLYYLADAMDYKNKVQIELIEGKKSIVYEISGFSHTLNVENQFERNLSLFNSDDELEIYAVPLNCSSELIELIPLSKNEEGYKIPKNDILNQFIIISSKKKESQLMPRFVNTDQTFVGTDKNERIKNYHAEFSERNFDDDIWNRLLAYFNICVKHDLPFSTFDQLRSISRSSEVASKAFFYLGINQYDINDFIQRQITEMEQDLGICFHWVKKNDWETALNKLNESYNGQYFDNILGILSKYMQENEFNDILKFIMGENIQNPNIMYSDIRELRAQLGERVLKELPQLTPKITNDYNITIDDHIPVKLLLKSPIAVAESISNIQNELSLWGGNDFRENIRRNIQYSQYLNPEFYTKTILHVLKNT
ncbi:hypothetical protein LNQ49_06640 [Flavobacterium sp. F-65]|uniref:Uncharacterized protein n=1 Tax=Flavobacterium pisciphilum TaxID=2893755 RepID=A0ABS8MR86_9FLAO|nr:hypothetical protein [Flavobacterium sp. F-65]MCC9071271.1 hypothetical protein [Flavobacterium sp. F-65]